MSFQYQHHVDSGIGSGPWWMTQWLPVVEASMFIVGFGLGMNNVPFLLITELCPSPVRALTSSLAMSVCALSVFTVVKVFPWAVTTLTLPGTYTFFAGISVLAVIFSSFFIPHHNKDSDSSAAAEGSCSSTISTTVTSNSHKPVDLE